MFVGETGSIYVETRHPAYDLIYDFLISCCEPESRTEHLEHYKLHSASLSAATAEGTYNCNMIREIIRHFRLSEQLELPIDLDQYRSLAELAMSASFDLKSAAPSANRDEKRVKLENQDAAQGDRDTREEKGTPRPLVSVTVVRPSLLSPLPKGIETLLLEEDKSTKLRVVLQPRLRKFNTTSSGPKEESGGELFYFIVSYDRAHLQRVLDEVQEFLEPIMLHGKPRYIISDVDWNVRDHNEGVVEAGKPAAMRRLFDPQYSTGDGAERRQRVEESSIVFKCQVKEGKLRNVKDRLFNQLGIRADCVYDYRQDKCMHVASLELAKHVRLRSYQVESLERFRRGRKAHQGVVVLPCGAGKTLTGIAAACEIQKRTIVLTVNNMSVFQWRREFLKWTDLKESDVSVCTLKQKEIPRSVFITTYSMLIAKRGAMKGESAQRSEEILEVVRNTPWGLMILDEVHTAPAKNFQEVINKVKFKCVLGLSATLLREDGKIDDLRHLVGPKLYEANWLQLTREGFLAKVQCAEVQCAMPVEFAAAYHKALGQTVYRVKEGAGGVRHKKKPHTLNYIASNFASCNPYKLWCTQALLSFHQSRSPPDKVIIFCDFLTEVEYYSKQLNIPYMNSDTSESERKNLLDYFQFSDLNAIILTRVGDVALDLPCATVIIQISGLGASRRQEAQRLGRILRPKPPSLDNTCSYFYTLVSRDTKEVHTSYGRQSWLRDQGFAYRVIQGETVLEEYKRTGGQLCCVGPPRWWFQVLPDEKKSHPDHSIVEHSNGFWEPFSSNASETIHAEFQQGNAECVLPEKWCTSSDRVAFTSTSGVVRFSSVNIPHSFGTLTVQQQRNAAEEVATRRVTVGRLEAHHTCDKDCQTYALRKLMAIQEGKTLAQVEDLSDPDQPQSGDDDEETDFF